MAIRDAASQTFGQHNLLRSVQNATFFGDIFDTAPYEMGLMIARTTTREDGNTEFFLEESNLSDMSDAVVISSDKTNGEFSDMALLNGVRNPLGESITVGIISHKRYVRFKVIHSGSGNTEVDCMIFAIVELKPK